MSGYNYYNELTAISESLKEISRSLTLLNKVIAALPSMNKVGYAPKATNDSKELIDNLSK